MKGQSIIIYVVDDYAAKNHFPPSNLYGEVYLPAPLCWKWPFDLLWPVEHGQKSKCASSKPKPLRNIKCFC